MTARNDPTLYERHATRWWAPDDRFYRSLRAVGAFHLGLVLEAWGPRLDGLRVADLGCGGGHLALALAARGAEVVGVDRSAASVRAAEEQARRTGSTARFVRSDLLRCPLDSGAFHRVVMTDVLEHVDAPALALREAARLLRDGGRLFLNTFDRTVASALLVVHLAEGLGLVPRGTHDPRLFVRPDELAEYARAAGLSVERVVRERPALLRTVRTWTVHLEAARRGPGFSAFLAKEPA